MTNSAKSARFLAVCALAAFAVPHPYAQSTPSSPAAETKPISSENLVDRAYNQFWPKPSFPSTEREKKQFTVEYVYRYVQSNYSPAVTIPQIKRAESQTDTPEHTFTAFISALKALDYDWWLSLWDVRSQQMFRDEAAKNQDPAHLKAQWQASFSGKSVTLYSRLETVRDILLEFRIGSDQPGKPSPLYPAPMRLEGGKWLLTRELSDQPFVPFLGKNTLSTSLDFIPVPAYTQQPAPPVAVQSQELFLRNQSQDSATDFVW